VISNKTINLSNTTVVLSGDVIVSGNLSVTNQGILLIGGDLFIAQNTTLVISSVSQVYTTQSTSFAGSLIINASNQSTQQTIYLFNYRSHQGQFSDIIVNGSGVCLEDVQYKENSLEVFLNPSGQCTTPQMNEYPVWEIILIVILPLFAIVVVVLILAIKPLRNKIFPFRAVKRKKRMDTTTHVGKIRELDKEWSP